MPPLVPYVLCATFAACVLFFGVGCDSNDSGETKPPLDFAETAAACTDGTAGEYPCRNVDLLARLSPTDLGVTSANAQVSDLWGWTDPQTSAQYALVGHPGGTAFVDVSDPRRPVYLGSLPSRGGPGAIQRDVKVYDNHAFVVAEADDHGMQVFDLTTLRDVDAGDAPQTFSETAHYGRFGAAHNLAINTETGFAYAVGLHGEQTPASCGPGYHGVDVTAPASPQFSTCHSSTLGRQGNGYTHDAQCTTYTGPDEDHRGAPICFGADETGLSITDFSDKSDVQQLATTGYPDVGYAHQGWLSDDQRYFYLGDELDERQGLVQNTRTVIFDVTDLDDPQVAGTYRGPTPATDHNLYTRGETLYEANYRSGLRILDASDPTAPEEVAFFDVYPQDDAAAFDGAWTVYPFFEDGPLLVSSIGGGLFVLEATL